MGVPQGSILGPLLFNIFICDLFMIINDIEISSYADDNTPYIASDNPENVIKALENVSEKLLLWFKNNGMKANADKCHLILSTKDSLTALIGESEIQNTEHEKLLGVLIDSELSFEKHVNSLSDKASQKLNALSVFTLMTSYLIKD